MYAGILLILPFIFFAPATRMELLLGDGDAFVQFLPFWAYAAEQWKNLTAPFWTPHIFSGFPLFAEPQASVFHPLKLLFFIFSPLAALNLTVLLYYGLAGLFTFLLAREEGLTPEAALLAGLSFSYCGFLIGHQAITALFITAASFPLTFYVLRRLLTKNSYPSVLAGAAAVLFLVLGGHPQFYFYSLFFGALYGVYLYLFVAAPSQKGPFLKSMLAVYVLGTALSAFQLLPSLELTAYSFRGKLAYEDFVAESLPAPTLLTSLISTRIYHIFPNHGSEAMLDVGLLVLLLAILGISRARRAAPFWIFLLLFSSLLFIGDKTPLYKVMFWIPGYNLFRVASRNGIALDLAIVMLAAYGLHAVQTRLRRGTRRVRLLALLAVPAVCYLGLYNSEQRIYDHLWKAGVEQGEALPWTWETVRTHLFPLAPELLTMVAAMALLSWLFNHVSGARPVALMCIVLAFIHFWSYRNWIFAAPATQVRESLHSGFDLLQWHSGDRPPDPQPYRIALGSPHDWIGFLEDDPERWRSRYVSGGGVDINMLHHISSISGYSPLILRDYSRLTGRMHMSGAIQDPAFFASPALSLLNVRYVLVPRGLGFPEETFTALERVEEWASHTLYRNPGAQGMFWGIQRIQKSSSEEFWRQMDSPSIDFSRVALGTEETDELLFSETFELPQNVEARFLDTNTIQVTVEASHQSFLVSAQPHYPGWFAWMDGKLTSIYRVNELFFGLLVPAGRHEIILRFIPPSFGLGLCLSLLSLPAFGMAAKKDLLGLRI